MIVVILLKEVRFLEFDYFAKKYFPFNVIEIQYKKETKNKYISENTWELFFFNKAYLMAIGVRLLKYVIFE